MRAVFAHDHVFVFDGNSYYSQSGLPGSVLQRYVGAFDEVDVICRSREIASSHLEPIDTSRLTFHPQPSVGSVSGLLRYPQVRRNIFQIVNNSDVVVARLPSVLGLIAARTARRLCVPYAVEVVGNASESVRLRSRGLWSSFAASVLERLTKREVRLATDAIYITDRYLQSVYPTDGRIHVCPNVDIQRIDDDAVERRLAQYRASSRRTIGMVGSLDVSYKGHETALSVVQELRRTHEMWDLRLEFVGAGETENLRALAERMNLNENVAFVGTLRSGEPILEWMDSVDLLLQPSQTEGQGRAIIEAMSRACPVVASNVGGIPELLDASVLTDPGDTAGLADRCAMVLNDEIRYRDQAIRNWQTAHLFLAERVEARRQRVFRSLRLQAVPARCCQNNREGGRPS